VWVRAWVSTPMTKEWACAREYEQYISAPVRWRTPVTVDQVHEILRPIDSAVAERLVEGIATIRSELATRAIEAVEPTPRHRCAFGLRAMGRIPGPHFCRVPSDSLRIVRILCTPSRRLAALAASPTCGRRWGAVLGRAAG
jgi:hypothetical protein